MSPRPFMVPSSAVMLVALLLGGAARAQVLQAELDPADPALGKLVGNALAIDGDTVIVGARGDDDSTGAAYAWRQSGEVWTQEAKLTAGAAVAQDQVGASVTVAGDVAVLGAPDPFQVFGPASGPGSAYVFRRSGTSWSQETVLLAGDGLSTDQFGSAVSLSGNACLVGARGDRATGAGSAFSGQGAGYVFRYDGFTWSEQAKLTAADGGTGDLLGTAAALDGDVAVLGAPGDAPAGAKSGSAYVFRWNGAAWVQEAKLVASDAAAGDSFGAAVAVSGNAIAVGSAQDDNTGSNSGSVYVFRWNGAAWTQEAKLTAGDAAGGDNYGSSVALRGAKLLVGAPGKSGGSGAGYVHQKIGATWFQQFKITQPDASQLGSSAGLTSETVALGAPNTDDAGLFAGAAYTWRIGPAALASISPVAGAMGVQTPVTLNGTNFAPFSPTTVTFDGVPATAVTWISTTQMTCLAPTGAQGAVVPVTLTQDGSPSTLAGAYTYQGITLATVSPGSGPSLGGPPITLTGTLFVNNGSTSVLFGANAASIVSITPPTTIVVNTPPGVRGSTVDVTVNCSNGTATVPGGFTYATLSASAINVAAGNLTGGTSVTVTVDYGTNVPDTSATIDGAPATVTAVTPTSVTLTTPSVTQATGTAVDVGIVNSNGTAALPAAFTYTPSLHTAITGNTTTGGTVTLTWELDPTAGSNQHITLWLGDVLGPPLGAHIFGFAGLLSRVPFVYILSNWPEATQPVVFNYGPLTPAIAGFPLHFQMIATGEGGTKGSFSNDSQFAIP